MKKLLAFMILVSLLLLMACEVKEPTQNDWDLSKNEIFFRKMVSIGNSITMGIQSAGIRQDFQENNYPAIIAGQAGIGAKFQQPIVATPGIAGGGMLPLELENGTLVQNPTTVQNPLTLLSNMNLPRPYDNLGISGATMPDVLNTTTSANSTNPTNPFYDMVLRNPNLGGLGILDQAIWLNPSLITLWIGNNPILGAALNGSDDPANIPTAADFQAQITQILQTLGTNTKAAIFMANIPNVTDIPYVNMLDILPKAPILGNPAMVGNVLVDLNFMPIDFNQDPAAELYLPLLIEEETEETDVAHILLPALSGYQQGLGVPDSATLVGMGMPAPQASAIVAGMVAAGLVPTGLPIPGNMTLTTTEKNTIAAAVDGYNAIIGGIATAQGIPLVDANQMLNDLNLAGIDGVTGRFALVDPANTGFSLDGVHPNNAGHAVIANAFIDKINAVLGMSIPKVNPADYTGQYIGGVTLKTSGNAFEQVKNLYPQLSSAK